MISEWEISLVPANPVRDCSACQKVDGERIGGNSEITVQGSELFTGASHRTSLAPQDHLTRFGQRIPATDRSQQH